MKIAGINEALVRRISREKNEPDWMLERRLEAFSLWERATLPNWGPKLDQLDLEKISFYIDPAISEKDRWEEVPKEIAETFEKLGIPKAERDYLGGVGAQYDSGMVYHKIKESLAKKGVIFENMDTAVQKYEDLVKKYFMTNCVPAKDHVFTMLHGALWSGGTFIYVPKGVKVSMPLQAYFRMNKKDSAQFEHTLIIADEDSAVFYIEGCSAPRYESSSLHAGCVELFALPNANIRYASIENWSKNTFNLNTKKAIVYEKASVEWLNGNMGSGVTMLYPSSVLIGEEAKSESLSIVFAGKDQIQDTGAKSIHLAQNTTSIIRSKSISKDSGVAIYRGFVEFGKRAAGSSASVLCEAMLLDKDSASFTYPAFKDNSASSKITHEAKTGAVKEEEVFYLKSRGLSEREGIRLLVGGFFGPAIGALPLEYALELNRLITLELDNV